MGARRRAIVSSLAAGQRDRSVRSGAAVALSVAAAALAVGAWGACARAPRRVTRGPIPEVAGELLAYDGGERTLSVRVRRIEQPGPDGPQIGAGEVVIFRVASYRTIDRTNPPKLPDGRIRESYVKVSNGQQWTSEELDQLRIGGDVEVQWTEDADGRPFALYIRGERALTRLHRAAEEGDLDTLRAMIAAGRSVNNVDRDRMTPLLRAAKNGHCRAVDLLLRNGALVDLASADGTTAIQYAAAGRHFECIELLAASGASVNAADEHGASLLYLAARDGDLELARRLLALGADVNRRRQYRGETPLDIARRNGHTEVAELLAASGGTRGGFTCADTWGRLRSGMTYAEVDRHWGVGPLGVLSGYSSQRMCEERGSGLYVKGKSFWLHFNRACRLEAWASAACPAFDSK